MASIRKRNSRWQARVARNGYPSQVRTFETKGDAERWARSVEADMDNGVFANMAATRKVTLGELIERFIREVTPGMKSAKEDTIRLRALAGKTIARHSMATLGATQVAAFRDKRLGEVSAGTVIRELAYLSSIINHARREWGLIGPNPVQLVRKPTAPPGRSRVLSADERLRLLAALEPTGRRSPWTKPIVLIALETAMRRGEILALRWKNIDLEQQFAFLPDTKNGSSRLVPLSTVAVQILRAMPRSDGEVVFPITSYALQAAFERARVRAGILNLRFHDLRHTAVSSMALKLPNIIELSAVTGHRSLAMLKRYYHPNAVDLAKKLG